MLIKALKLLEDIKSRLPSLPTMGAGRIAGAPAPDIQREIASAAVIIGVFFVGFLGWAGFAPLQSAAIAQGVVSVDGSRKTIQHLEGGIVSEILVREGDIVEAGQILIRLEETTPRATSELLRGRWMVASALEARLKAERDHLEEIEFPVELTARNDDPKVAQIIKGQNNIFESRRGVMAGQSSILQQRIAQLNEEINGIKGQIHAEDIQITLIKEEIADVKALFEKGFARKPRLLQLQRRAAELEGTRNLHQAQIARAKQNITETNIRTNELKNSMLNEVVEELRRTQSELYDLDERLRAAGDVLSRTEIRSPLSGTVVGLQVHTAGGVIASGAPLLDVVPNEMSLVVEAKINPRDIDIVRNGLNAQVRFTAFNQRHRAPAEGKVTAISADRLSDENSGDDYYLARIELGAEQDASIDITELRPGMQAEVMIVTGERTAIEYFLEPVAQSFGRAFRED